MSGQGYDPFDEGRSAATVEQEKLILGAILLHNDLPMECDRLQPQHFYLPEHATIYTAMQRIAKRGDPVTYVQVKIDLEKHGAGDLGLELHRLNVDWQLRRDVAPCVSQVFDAWRLRRLEQYAKTILSLARTPTSTATAVLDSAERELSAMAVLDDDRSGPKLLGEIFAEGWPELEARIDQRRPRSGVTTGLVDLDAETSGGWKNGQLVVIGGRPSQGKTSLALQSAVAAARGGLSVLFFSAETSTESLMDRILASEARVDGKALGEGRLTQSELQRVSAARLALDDLPLAIEDEGPWTVTALRAKSRRHKAKHGLDAVYLDYLQLFQESDRSNNSTREQQVGAVSRGLKLLAKDLGVPVVAVSQLSRKVEDRTDQKPRLSDLRDSGQIEQDADVVIFPFFPGVEGVPPEGPATLIVAKQKDGPVSEGVMVSWNPRNVRFDDRASAFGRRGAA